MYTAKDQGKVPIQGPWMSLRGGPVCANPGQFQYSQELSEAVGHQVGLVPVQDGAIPQIKL